MGNSHLKKYNTQEFINEAKKIHGDKYDYSITVYLSKHKKIKYICPEHGIIEQTPHNHIYGKFGCHKCGLEKLKSSRRKTTKDFIDEATMIYDSYYDYSKVNYINNRTKIIITCPVHGDFEIRPMNHLHLYQGCKLCNKK